MWRGVPARARSLSPLATDAAFAAVLCVGWTVEVVANGPRPGALSATLVAGWAMIAPVVWRRRAPVASLAAHGVLMSLAAALGTGVLDGPHNVEGVAIAVLLYSVSAHAEGRRVLVTGTAVGLAVVVGHSVLVGAPAGPGGVISSVAFVAAAMLAGRTMRQRRRLTHELEEQAARLRAEREWRARSVAGEERRRIARELHDVVTHVLGGMVVEAASLRRTRQGAGAVAETLGEIERSGRDALVEMRRLLAVLRGGDPQPLAPAPTTRQLPALVERAREDGMGVDLEVQGSPGPLPRRVDIAVYHVVEELLESARAAGERRALVALRHGSGETEVCVTAQADRDELGAIGERVALCGGELQTGATAASRLEVRARFPHDGSVKPPAGASGPRPTSRDAGEPPPRAPASWRRFGDLALAAALMAALCVDAAAGGDIRGGAAPNAIAFAVIAGTFAWRRRAPLAAAVTFAAALVALTAFLTPLPQLETAQVALVLATYLAATGTAGRAAAIAFASIAASVAASVFVYGVADLSSRQIYALVTLTLIAWLTGRAARGRKLLNRLLREKAAAIARERDERAREAAAAVRRQIARELHDVVAHSLTVMIVQAGSARRIAGSRPAEALQAAALIDATGREALGEMRRLLSVMGNEEGGGPPLAAAPGIESLETLIARSRAAGLPVELRRDGDVRPLPVGVDIAAFRVAQEAITNSIKHAGASHAELVVRYRPNELELVLTDDGHGPPAEMNGGGHGLVGMRERVGVYGGALEAGGGEGGGFRVRARFPLETPA